MSEATALAERERIVAWLKQWARNVFPEGAVLWHVACLIESGEHEKPRA